MGWPSVLFFLCHCQSLVPNVFTIIIIIVSASSYSIVLYDVMMALPIACFSARIPCFSGCLQLGNELQKQKLKRSSHLIGQFGHMIAFASYKQHSITTSCLDTEVTRHCASINGDMESSKINMHSCTLQFEAWV